MVAGFMKVIRQHFYRIAPGRCVEKVGRYVGHQHSILEGGRKRITSQHIKTYVFNIKIFNNISSVQKFKPFLPILFHSLVNDFVFNVQIFY